MATHLVAGDKAPSLKGKDQKGKSVSLTDFKGKKVVIYFYPQDDTPVCTVQACNLRDNYEILQENGYIVIGISPDNVASHAQFEAKYQLPFILIADPEHIIINQYGVWGEKNMYGRKYMGLIRTTFVVDEKGIIQKIIKKPKSKTHAEEIMK